MSTDVGVVTRSATADMVHATGALVDHARAVHDGPTDPAVTAAAMLALAIVADAIARDARAHASAIALACVA